MRVNRKIVVSLAALLVFGLMPLWAQTGQTEQTPGATAPGQGYGRHMGRRGGQRGGQADRLAQELNLTQEQRQKLQPIFQQQMQQRRALRQDTSLTAEQRQQKMQALRQSTHDQINGILTPEQQEKWKQLRQNRGGRGKGPGGGMASRLNLTPDQQTKLKPIFEDTRSKMQALRQDTSLTAEQRRQKMQELRQSTHDQINGILTPEQQQQWQQMRSRRGRKMGPPPGPSGF